MAPSAAVDLAWLKTHVGHEVKYMTYAGAQFRIRCDAADFGSVAMQDSTLTRARALLDFIRSGDRRNGHLDDFYSSPGTENWTDTEAEVFEFVSRVLSHVSADRDNASGRWPGVGEGPLQNELLARLVLSALEARLPKVRTDARVLLELMVERARQYLDDPTEHRFHQMDPANL